MTVEATIRAEGESILERVSIAVTAAIWVASACSNVPGGESTGFTRLMRAAASGEAHSVDALLDAGADPNETDGRGNSALSLAAQFGRDEIVLRLIEANAEVDRADAEGETALMKAAAMGHDETVALLLRAGADPDLRDRRGRTAADRARSQGRRALAETLDSAR